MTMLLVFSLGITEVRAEEGTSHLDPNPLASKSRHGQGGWCSCPHSTGMGSAVPPQGAPVSGHTANVTLHTQCHAVMQVTTQFGVLQHMAVGLLSPQCRPSCKGCKTGGTGLILCLAHGSELIYTLENPHPQRH